MNYAKVSYYFIGFKHESNQTNVYFTTTVER